MAKLETIGKWIVYGFAIFGALVFVSGGLSVAFRELEYQEPPRPKRVCVEIKTPRLNWEAADRALTERLGGWNEAMRWRSDAEPVWQPTKPIQGHQPPSLNERVWQP